jgi:signal transduction histidine kinase
MEQARRTLKESRRAIDDLRSEIGRKSEADVSSLVHGLAEQLSREHGKPVRMRSEVSGHAQVSEHVVSDLSAIIREAVHNAVYHGECNEVWITLSTEEGLLQVQINDRGRGFDEKRLPEAGHYGIRGMRERAGEIGATLSLSSRPGSGTSVAITLPPAVGAAHG